MTGKTHIVEELGETALVLPNLVGSGLRANDRAKYYMSLMQACREHAACPDQPSPDLRIEREASGEDDSTLDDVVSQSRAGLENAMFVPQAERIHTGILGCVEQMMAPLRASVAALAGPIDVYESRLTELRRSLPVVAGDTVPGGYVEALTCADRRGPDSLHLLVMDLHRELNQVQRSLAEESLDGASVYGLSASDQPLVRAFMRGVNRTAALKFDHPGLGTTATRMGSELVLQNDIGTTDAHVFVAHVNQLDLSFIYTDIHRARLEFFKGLFDPIGIAWTERSSGGGQYETCVGRRTCTDLDEVQQLLAFIGSRLVFLIDWNQARKRLSRFVKKADAVAVLRWAAERDYGHRAFLEAGAERLVYNALQRTAPPDLRYGSRLDEVLGQQAATSFLQAVLKITSEGLQQHRSLRLVRDEVQAELLGHLHESQQGMLALAADHAGLIVALAHLVHDVVVRMGSASKASMSSVAVRAKRWETKADDLVSQARQSKRPALDEDAVARLLPSADDVADGLEEAVFLMSLLDHQDGRSAVRILEPLARLTVMSAREYVKCLEVARDVRRNGTRDDVQQFLVAVEGVITLEHESDEAERRAEEAMLTAADDFRVLHLLSQIANGLEESVDDLARCALMLKDLVMSEMIVE